jgi:hypothetical protein
MLGVLRDGASVILNASITADMGLPGLVRLSDHVSPFHDTVGEFTEAAG